jgi:hypothetical protein
MVVLIKVLEKMDLLFLIINKKALIMRIMVIILKFRMMEKYW